MSSPLVFLCGYFPLHLSIPNLHPCPVTRIPPTHPTPTGQSAAFTPGGACFISSNMFPMKIRDMLVIALFPYQGSGPVLRGCESCGCTGHQCKGGCCFGPESLIPSPFQSGCCLGLSLLLLVLLACVWCGHLPPPPKALMPRRRRRQWKAGMEESG